MIRPATREVADNTYILTNLIWHFGEKCELVAKRHTGIHFAVVPILFLLFHRRGYQLKRGSGVLPIKALQFAYFL